MIKRVVIAAFLIASAFAALPVSEAAAQSIWDMERLEEVRSGRTILYIQGLWPLS